VRTLRYHTFIAALGIAWMTTSSALAAGLSAAVTDNGSIAIKEGDKVLATMVPKTQADHRGTPAVRTVQIAKHTILDLRIPIRGDGGASRQETWIAEQIAGGSKVIWWDVAGARDTDGETNLVAAVTDKSIELYQTAARLSRCDGAPVPLFRKTWDFTSKTFRPAPPELPPSAPTTLKAKRGEAPSVRSLGGFYFAAASSSAGAQDDAAKLRPPAQVNDGDPATVWTSEGSGRGQLLTARSSGGFPITGLRLLPGDTSSEKSYRASAKPKKLGLVFGRDPAQSLEIDLVEDADGGARRFREPYWIPLPNPVASSCVTVVVREVTNDKTPMSIGDLDVLTEIDGPGAAERLVASLAQGQSCAARQPLLVRLGAPVLGQVTAALGQAEPGPGRACLLEALDALLAAGAAPDATLAGALVHGLVRATEDEEKIVFKLLRKYPESAIDPIAALAGDDKRDEQDRARAARALAAIGSDAAVAKLLAMLGQGAPTLRKAVRTALTGASTPAANAALTALRATPAGETARRADLYAVIGVLAAREQSALPEALSVLRAPLHEQASFEEQARAIQALGNLRTPEAIDVLVGVRASSKNAVLRAFAVGEIAGTTLPSALPALRAALDDEDPRVRETAASALGHRMDKTAAALLVAGAKQEPWPKVRHAEIAALGELCTTDGNALLVRAFKKDVEEVRQAALVGLAHCYPGKANAMLLYVFGRLPESADMRSLAVRLLAERKDAQAVHGMVEVLTRLLQESQADLSLEGVVTETAMALASLRGPEAVAALIGLLSDPRPSIKRAGIDALGVVCDPGPGLAALHAAAVGQDESVAGPAASAERHCRETR
jgi:HEAT repeat protein